MNGLNINIKTLVIIFLAFIGMIISFLFSEVGTAALFIGLLFGLFYSLYAENSAFMAGRIIEKKNIEELLRDTVEFFENIIEKNKDEK